jgi:hypothetical protein
MPDEPQEQPTEQTPKGLTVPVPRREDFLGNLKKVAEPDPQQDQEADGDNESVAEDSR